MNWLLLKNSLLVGGIATVLAVSFGLCSALWLAGLDRRWRNRFFALAVISLALPPFLVTNCWLDLLGYTGVWRQWLPLNIFSLGGASWLLALLLWPITLFAVWSAWRRLEPAQLESDPALSGWWLLRGLLLPLGRSALAQAAVLTLVLALNNFAVPAILQVKVFPAEAWVRFNTTFDTAGALLLSWPLIAGPLLLLFWLYRRELPWPRTQAPVSPRLFRQQLGRAWSWSCGALTIALCSLSVGLPLYQLLSVRRTWAELPGAVLAGQTAIWNSFLFATLAATLILLLALAGQANPKPEFRRFARTHATLLWLPFLIPGVLLGIALIQLFNHEWSSRFYQSIGIVILALGVRYLALGWNTVAHGAQAVDRDLRDAARLEGANGWQMFRCVYWPQIAPQALAAWYVIFLLCLWDVESMILVVPPGGETLALRIFNLLHYGHNTQVNALCLTLLGVAVAPLVLWGLWSAVSGGVGRKSKVESPKSKVSSPSSVVNSTRLAMPAAGTTVLSDALHVSRFTFHASGITLLALSAALLFTGCAPRSSSTDSPISSLLFNRVRVIGTRGVGVGQLNKPRSVAVDKLDNLYVVDMTGRVQKFSSNGVFALSWQMPQTDLGRPKGMGRDLAGNIIVVEPHYQRVNYFSTEGKLLAQFGQKGTNAGQLSMPRAVAVDSKGEIFLSEYGEVERVQKFILGLGVAQFLGSFGKPGTGPGEFNRPEGLCVDAHDRLYVADSCNHRIQVFDRDGKFLRAYGKAGQGKGELSYPYDICVDGVGRQYVCEFGNSRIQVFDANDQPIEIIGGPGAEPGRFSNPWAVALDSAGNLYVADSQNHRVQKLVRN